jgi:hypothetical protein
MSDGNESLAAFFFGLLLGGCFTLVISLSLWDGAMRNFRHRLVTDPNGIAACRSQALLEIQLAQQAKLVAGGN